MHFVHTICVVCLFHIFNSFPSPATGQDRDALKRCGPKFGFFFQCDDTGKYLVIGIQDMFFGIWGAFIRGDAGRVFCLFPGPAAGRDWDRGRGRRTAQASDTTPVGAQDPEGTLLVLLAKKRD